MRDGSGTDQYSARRRTYPTDVAKSFDDECEGLLVVAHATQQEDHLSHKVSFLADIVRLYNENLE
jgi:hypothetical protein